MKNQIPTQFRYRLMLPDLDEYPFDKPALRILEELRKRNWDVPGYTIKWDRNLTGEEKNIKVQAVTGPNLFLRFSRSRREGGFRYPLSVGDIYVGRIAMTIYGDTHSYNAMLYCGSDAEWERDKAYFLKERIAVSSIGIRKDCPIKFFKSSKGRLVPENLRWNETPSETIEIEVFLKTVTEVLWEIVKELETLPCPEYDENAHLTQNLIEFKSPFEGDLFAFCKWDEYAHLVAINEGHSNTGAKNYGIAPQDALTGLQSLYFSNWNPEWGIDLRQLWSKFIWCFEANTGYLNKEEVPWQVQRADLITSGYPVKIKPKYANNIFVIDEAVYWRGARGISEKYAEG